MPNFSFLVPTRGRPDLVARFFQSVIDTTSCLDDLEIVLCVDDDDLESQKITHDKLLIKKVILPKGTTMGSLNRACFDASSGRYVMLLNDDVILRTKNWDKIIFSVFSSYEDDIALIHTNDLLFREKLCTFPMLSRKACLEIGICPSEYQRYRIDDHIYDIYNMLAYLGHKRIVYLPDVIFEHDNYAHGQKGHNGQIFKSDDNKVYLPDQKTIESDARIFDGKIEERKQNALKLACLIEESKYYEKKVAYKGLLNGIKDSYSYRRSDFIKTVSSTDSDLQTSPTVTIAVVTSDIYKDHPQRCLSLLKKHTSNFDLLILDNNNSKDFNHPREMNKVLRSIETDFLVLMDDDVFVEEGWLDGLLQCMDGETGVVTPLHKDRNGRLSYSGAYLLGDNNGKHMHHLDMPDKPRETQAACSACILIDMRKCGHLRFNTAYKKYFLDIDFAIQVWEAGYKVMVTPESVVTHLGGATMPWSSELASTLVKRDESIFVEIWIKSGRIEKVINGIWSRIPFIQHVTEVPKIIDEALKDIPNQDFDQFKGRVENLITKIKPLRLFHHKIVQKLERQILLSESKGDKISVHYCNKAISQLTDTSLLYRKFLMIIKKFLMIIKRLLARLAPLILSKPYFYRFAVPMHNVLKKIFDRYLRLPLFVRKITDIFVLNIGAIIVSVKEAQKEQQISINPASCEPLPADLPQGGTLFVGSLPPQKIKKYLDKIHLDIEHTVFLLPKRFKNAWQQHPAILLKDLFEKDSDSIDINNTSGVLMRELKARNFDLAIIPYDDPINWEDSSLERFIAPFAKNFKIIFPDGKQRLYTRYDDLNRITYNKAYLGRMFNFVPRPKGKKILDVGCSDGLVCDLLLNEDPESIVGIDVVETVGENYKDPKITYRRMDAHSLSFEEHSFDLTFSIATLEHCNDPLKVLKEMRRITKKGGYCYVQAGPLYHSPFGHHMFGYFDDYPWIHLRLSKDEIIKYCRYKGIDKKIESSTGMSVTDYITGMININHINGLTFKEYRLDEFMSLNDIKVLNFSRSYEGATLLTKEIMNELKDFEKDDLIAHGFELVFQVR